MKLLPIIIAAAIGFPAIAQERQMRVCDDLQTQLDALEHNWGEHLVWNGFTGDSVLLLTENGETGSWTLLRSDATKKTCRIQSGEMSYQVPTKKEGEPL